jgi:hypothetical protein
MANSLNSLKIAHLRAMMFCYILFRGLSRKGNTIGYCAGLRIQHEVLLNKKMFYERLLQLDVRTNCDKFKDFRYGITKGVGRSDRGGQEQI